MNSGEIANWTTRLAEGAILPGPDKIVDAAYMEKVSDVFLQPAILFYRLIVVMKAV